MRNRSKVLQVSDLLQIAADAAEMLKSRIARQDTPNGRISGWHGRFSPGRIGSPGSSIPLRFFREHGGLDLNTHKEVIKAIVGAQYTDGENAGGWHILSVSGTPSVEGTAPTLEALIGTRGDGIGQAIRLAQRWLEKAQLADGGWGSTAGGPPRLYTTALALLALSRLESPNSEAIDGAIKWLANTQRADGSWGQTPSDPGTLVHTAFAVRALAGAGVIFEDRAIVDGLKFICTKWTPDPKAFQQEAYDFHVGNTYHRVTAVYDVDAEVALAIMSIRPNGLETMLWDAAAEWVASNKSGTKWWQRDDDQLAVWTVVPRALVALRIARQHCPGGTTLRWRHNVVTVSSKKGWGPILGLSLSAVRPSRSWQRAAIGVVCIGVAIAVLTLALTRRLDTQNAVIGVLLPLALFALQLPHTSRENS